MGGHIFPDTKTIFMLYGKIKKDSIGGKQTCIYGHFRNDIAYQWGKEVLSSSFLLSLMVLEKLVISLSKLNSLS